MAPTDVNELERTLSQVRTWSPEMRLHLAEQLLRSLHPFLRDEISQGMPADQVRGIGAGAGAPPNDETIKEWVDEHRREKYA